jgi:hypothetical protein
MSISQTGKKEQAAESLNISAKLLLVAKIDLFRRRFIEGHT